jgi:GNAT superfamily N-acetyltransferase
MADLAVQLGYECTGREVQMRLGEMQDSPQYAVYVAELSGCHVVGWIAAYVFRAVELDPFAEISGLIVDQALRCSGIGKILLDAAEKWARHVGCSSISVHSNVTRDRAHHFYKNNGFELLKTQRMFQKALSRTKHRVGRAPAKDHG